MVINCVQKVKTLKTQKDKGAKERGTQLFLSLKTPPFFLR